MSTTSTGTYMEHPLVRAYLHDLDIALRDLSAREAGEIRESIREHLISEFSLRLADTGASVSVVVTETLDRLGPVESIIGGLAEGEEGRQAQTATATQRRTIAAVVLTTLSVVLAPFAVGVSAILSAIALVVAVKWVSFRARTPLIVVNVLVLIVALVYLIIALTTAGALFGAVQGAG